MSPMEPKTATLHGRPVSYVAAGAGPVLLLIHGMAGTYENWQAVIEPLARADTVVALDLPGHGGSAAGAGDYSLGAFAVGLRDLLVTLGYERATLVGHSLGGEIAMQFAYHFPEITERLVLVSSGGLGPELSLVLRAAALRDDRIAGERSSRRPRAGDAFATDAIARAGQGPVRSQRRSLPVRVASLRRPRCRTDKPREDGMHDRGAGRLGTRDDPAPPSWTVAGRPAPSRSFVQWGAPP